MRLERSWSSIESLEMIAAMKEQLYQCSYLNDHVMRGPLCRALGLLYLLQKTEAADQRDALMAKLDHEVRQIDVATRYVSQVIEEFSRSLPEQPNK